MTDSSAPPQRPPVAASHGGRAPNPALGVRPATLVAVLGSAFLASAVPVALLFVQLHGLDWVRRSDLERAAVLSALCAVLGVGVWLGMVRHRERRLSWTVFATGVVASGVAASTAPGLALGLVNGWLEGMLARMDVLRIIALGSSTLLVGTCLIAMYATLAIRWCAARRRRARVGDPAA